MTLSKEDARQEGAYAPEARKSGVEVPASKGGVERGLYEALSEMVRGYEADCACRRVEPDNVVMNHTWLALAYNNALAALKKARGE